jgi:hypothetical protein
MSTKSVTDLHSCEKSHLRIFLSADIVGSTAYKQKTAVGSPGRPPAWFSLVLLFYKLAEQTFAEKWKDIAGPESTYDPELCGESPELWKTIGDEVLFAKLVTHPGQIYLCLHAWIETLDILRSELRARGLDVKSTAWVAEFPLKNQEVVLFKKSSGALAENDQDYFRQNHENLVKFYDSSASMKDVFIDYIGPSIDTGFRLGSFSSSRKLVLSVELAYILSNEESRDNTKRTYAKGRNRLDELLFRYEGRFALKGVLNSDPYPIIWLDLDPDNILVKAEEAVIKVHYPTPEEIRALAEAYINTHDLLGVPHIAGGGYSEYNENEDERNAALVERHEIILAMCHSSRIEKEVPDRSEASAIEDRPPDAQNFISNFWNDKELWGNRITNK